MRQFRRIGGYVTGISPVINEIPWYIPHFWAGDSYKCVELTIRTKGGEEGRINLKQKEEKIRLYDYHKQENRELIENLRNCFEKNAILVVKGTFSRKPYLLGRDKTWKGFISVFDENENLLEKYQIKTRRCWTHEGESFLRQIKNKGNPPNLPSFSES